MQSLFRYFCIFIYMFTLTNLNAFESVYTLNEVVVRGEREPRNASQTMVAIDGESITNSNANTAGDIIEHIPGVFVSRTGAFGRSDIDMRGLGNRGTRVLILLDGRPAKMGIFGCTITHTLTANNIESIEVLKGPSSVLYGTDAIAGVVNIRTKKAADQHECSIFSSYGTYNTQKYSLEYGKTIGKVDYFITADKRESDGNILNSAYSGKNYTMRLGYAYSDTFDIVFRANAYDGFKQEPVPAIAGTWNKYKRGALDITLTKAVDNGRFSCKVYRDMGNHHFSDGWDSVDSTDGLIVDGEKRFSQNSLFQVGAAFKRQKGSRFNFPKGTWKKDESSVYVMEQFKFFERLNTIIGLRGVSDEIAGTHFSPEAGFTYTFKQDTTMRMRVSQGFRNPSIKDLYIYPVSNPKLKPEIIWSYECGLRHKISPSIVFDATGYVTEGNDFIEFLPKTKQFENTDSWDSKGVELMSSFGITKDISAKLGYAFLDSGDKTKGKAKHTGTTSFVYQKNVSRISCNVKYVGGYYADDFYKAKLDDYAICDVRYGYDFKKGWDVFIAVANIFDKTYQMYVDSPSGSGLYEMPERTVDMGVRYRF